LPLAGSVRVQGLSVEQATQSVSGRFQRVLRYPIVTVSMLQRRPVRVVISGEVNRPGVYTSDQLAANTANSLLPQSTLTRLLRQAGGITQQADLRNVTITRNGRSRTVNLWSLLNKSDLAQDPILLDGDQVQVPVAMDLKASELRGLSTASFAPDVIQVNIVGEVLKPGPVPVAPNTPLNQAILAAGGFIDRSDSSQVELVRLEPDGSVRKRSITIDLAAAPNEENNPPLRPNDTVIIAKNGYTAATDGLRTLLAPLGAASPASILFPFLR
jgi:polysaccharide export outer membrane protein